MMLKSLKLIGLLGASSVALSACSIASGYSKSEQEIVTSMEASKFQPANREVRDNIDTQDNFAQAAFWSREYQLNPADLEASIKLAAAVRKMGNASKAVEITQTTRALYPNDPYLAAEYAAALIATERGGEAISALDTALRAAPAYARLWSLKGAALDQMENYDLARRHYARALQITPRDPNVMTNMGLSYALAGDPYQAEGWLRKAMAQPGAGANTRQNLDLIMQLQGKDPQKTQVANRETPNVRQYENRPQSRSNAQYTGFRQAPSAQRASRQPAPQGMRQASQQSYATHTRSQQTRSQQAPRGQSRAPQAQTQQHTQPSYPKGYRQQAAQRPAPQGYQGQSQQRQAQPLPVRGQQAYAPGTQRGYKQTPQNSPQSFGHRSTVTVVGGKDGAPKSAAELARSIAQKSQTQNRRVVAPAGAAPKTQEQTNILDQISKNIGPRPTGQATATRPTYRQQQGAPVVDYPAPETLERRYNPYAQNMNRPQGDPEYGRPHPQQQNPYFAQEDSRPTSRGAARRRR